MPIAIYGRALPLAENPLSALQQKARRLSYHVLKARNFAAYKNTTADYLDHVLIYDQAGVQLAGPFDLDAADTWIASAAYARMAGRTRGGAS